MTLHWTKEDDPRWDADKQRLFGPEDLAAVDLDPPAPGAAVADEWWQVTGDDGKIAGYGWLDSEWGDAADPAFWVIPARRGAGVGEFILDHLEDRARCARTELHLQRGPRGPPGTQPPSRAG